MSNWPSFKIDFLAFLRSRGLKKYLFQKNPYTIPTDSKESNPYEIWHDESDKVSGLIMMCCSKLVRHHIVNIEDSVERWSKLVQVFEGCKGNEWSLLLKLNNLRYDGTDIDSHMGNIKDLHSQLLCRIPGFPEYIVTAALLNSIQDKHPSLVSSLFARET